MNETVPSKTWSAGNLLLFIGIPLLIGILISFLIPTPIIGVIHLDDAIYSKSAGDLIAQLIYARDNPNIKAVVLVINSPGGTVSDTEAIYGEIIRLRQYKPVVTFIQGMAASAAYFISSSTDYIIAQPSSLVGHIGVISTLPPSPLLVEDTYSTGPYKLTGEPRDTSMREIELAKQGFLQVVLSGRSKVLKIDQSTLLRAQIWTGIEALKMGIIDELGANGRAYEKAADLAKIANYRIEDLKVPAGVVPPPTPTQFFLTSANGMISSYPARPGVYMLYIPPMERQP